MVPTMLEMHTIMPKWITSIPILWAIGQRTGTKKNSDSSSFHECTEDQQDNGNYEAEQRGI